MGKKIVLTGTKITNTAAPKLARFDPIETHGSLLLVDATHPAGAWASGVPANGAKVPNLLAEFAAPVLGIDDAAAHSPNILVDRMDGTHGFAERSARGGLHAAYANKLPANIDNTAPGFGVTRYRVEATSNQRDYVRLNWGHTFYMSTWLRVTRGGRSGVYPNAVTALGHSTSTTGNFFAYISQVGVTVRAGAGKTDGVSWNPETNIGPRFAAAEAFNTTNTAPGSHSGVLAYPFQVGNNGTISSYLTAKEAAPSAVFYRHYMEDLTVSGRTYAEVEAIDRALYTREVLTEGGRYYGDTVPTDPATINA